MIGAVSTAATTENSNYGTTKKVLPKIISQYLCKSPINRWLWFYPNSPQSTQVNILETEFDDKLVPKRNL